MGEPGASVRAHYDQVGPGLLCGFDNHAFVALNTAFQTDGAFLYLPQGTVLEKPVNLLFLTTSAEEPTAAHPRTAVWQGP